MKGTVSLLIDSGAFSAWTQGDKIDLEEYIRFCLDHIDVADAVVNLDVIPGVPYGRITAKDVEKSAEEGWQNYKRMLEAGIPREKLIHVFHQGEDMRWLERMVKEIPYIGLSPANDRSRSQKIMWLDRCMKYVTDEEGYPKVKLHGFAVTSLEMLKRYPWYSVDSSSWVLSSAMGKIFVPLYRNGRWIYDEKFWGVYVSGRNPNRKNKSSGHFSTLSSRQQEIVLNYLESIGFRMGKSRFVSVPQTHELSSNEKWAEKRPKDPNKPRLLEIIEEEGVCNSLRMRDEVNIIFFQKVEEALSKRERRYMLKGVGRLIL